MEVYFEHSPITRRLTSALSGPGTARTARRERKISPHASGAPPAPCHGPLQRIVRCQSELIPSDVQCAMKHAEDLDVSVVADQIGDAVVTI